MVHAQNLKKNDFISNMPAWILKTKDYVDLDNKKHNLKKILITESHNS